MTNKKFNHWQIAYRTAGEEKFKLLPNPSYAWAADPFLAEYRGEIYLFAELFLYKSERNGVIGVCKFKDGSFGSWEIAMDKHWHLSYPNVFVYEDELYMCPESYQMEEIAIYRLVEFPDKWEKVETIVDNIKAVDSTFFQYEGVNYMFTFLPDFCDAKGKLLLYCKDEKGWSFLQYITDDVGSARPGGQVIVQSDYMIRVAQDSLAGYGSGLVFNAIDTIRPKYTEHEIKRVMPVDIQGIQKGKYIGIHTYNFLQGIEVIDLKFQTFSWREYFAQKRVRKVFLNKYAR